MNKKKKTQANSKKKTKRVGAAKKELEEFNMSLEEFNSIPTEDFGIK